MDQKLDLITELVAIKPGTLEIYIWFYDAYNFLSADVHDRPAGFGVNKF